MSAVWRPETVFMVDGDHLRGMKVDSMRMMRGEQLKVIAMASGYKGEKTSVADSLTEKRNLSVSAR